MAKRNKNSPVPEKPSSSTTAPATTAMARTTAAAPPRRNRKVSRRAAPPDFEALRELFKHHIESFDHMLEYGIETMFTTIKPVEIIDPLTNKSLRISFGDSKPEIYPPQKERNLGKMQEALYPFECRQAKMSYVGNFITDVCFQYDSNGPIIREKFNFGQFPIMLMSKRCHLRGADPQKLVSCKEESSEMGGYFILNGLERVIRLIILPKRNYPTSMVRNSFRDRREGYSDKAVVIRCVREDQSAVSVKLYYLNNGSARLGFWIQGREYLLPVGVVLKALTDTTDHELYVSLTCCYNEKYKGEKGCVGTPLVGERVKIILDEVRDLSLFTRSQCLQHLGEHFQPVMVGLENKSFSFVADAVLKDYIFVHLDNNQDKFNLLIFMLQKLFSLIDHTSAPDNPDSLQNQEVLLPGHLITIYLKEKLQEWLLKARELLLEEINSENKSFDFGSLDQVRKVMNKSNPSRQISSAVENMLKTGRLVTQSGLDLQQRAGLTVQAERLNFLRFISHFRAVHRGASFAGLRTTSVRKLLPESWGFLCPVHTPDGEPCGLLNHMACNCRITSYYDSQGNARDFFKMRMSVLSVLVGVGMTPSLPKLMQAGPPEVLSVVLDGRVVGSIPSDIADKAVSHLRRLKLSATSGIPVDLEVGYVPLSMGGAYPGLFIFTSPSRFIRPVRNISVPAEETNDIELIGPFEQVYMEIRCEDGGDGGRGNNLPATHEEIHPTGILSVVANLTPWSDHNQSPRNMYQCQMAKQTMAFSSQTINCRADQKIYHLQTPQTPIVRTKTYEKYSIDEFPLGTNAIVAVLAYSGYDMEDAMVLNKSSVDRGMFHGQIYQTETIDLAEQGSKSSRSHRMFRRSNLDKSVSSLIDSDGLPYVGQTLNPGDPYCSVYDEITNATKLTKLKGSEPVIVDYVAVDVKKRKQLQKVNIRFRRSRNPIIGDKFSSRHGQKGVCSQLWSDTDMPFSGHTGMRPDLIINPHAFPSRMTIAMLLESIAAKGGSLDGQFVNATPFYSTSKKATKESESEVLNATYSSLVKKAGEESESKPDSLVDELGSMLASYGFNYHGLEVLYSGVYGTELTCEIFIGPVYYQRLRHMVSDKYQVRSTGTIDQVTRQPIKGRKRGGGIRFGEMERDSLLAHGAAYLLHDRLHTCSDHHIADVCSLCGSILTTSIIQPQKRAVREIGGLPPGRAPKKVICTACQSSKGMETVAMPYVFRYLAAELAAMNIKMTLQLSNGAGA
ncbi:DNA-directed RNA polymerase I subunit 2 [Rhododendron vialii]|uniref:DNA-directed RNA polymerase I subunit 2 n=1 Tax=Rhododendron vialii TaxID=182163 RepID=UPI00265E3345|nr:DNA-directed RNA polymerase I subunit 2 [Rhododendron vialii]